LGCWRFLKKTGTLRRNEQKRGRSKGHLPAGKRKLRALPLAIGTQIRGRNNTHERKRAMLFGWAGKRKWQIFQIQFCSHWELQPKTKVIDTRGGG